MALTFPPIAPEFLAMFGPTASVIWENPCMGLFLVVLPSPDVATHHTKYAPSFELPTNPLPPPVVSEYIVEVDTHLDIPVIPENDRSADPPVCLHNVSALQLESNFHVFRL